MGKSIGFFLFSMLFIISCESYKPVQRLSDEGIVYAMIYDNDNMQVSGVEVYLDGRKTADSDIQGRFILNSLKKKKYHIKLIKAGYEPFESDFTYIPLNVLYFKTINTAQLVRLAENAMDDKSYNEANAFIDRALAVEPGRIDILYLKCINFYLMGDHRSSLSLINELSTIYPGEKSITKLKEDILSMEVAPDLPGE